MEVHPDSDEKNNQNRNTIKNTLKNNHKAIGSINKAMETHSKSNRKTASKVMETGKKRWTSIQKKWKRI